MLVWLGLPGEGPALLCAGRARFTGTLPWDVLGAVCAADGEGAEGVTTVAAGIGPARRLQATEDAALVEGGLAAQPARLCGCFLCVG